MNTIKILKDEDNQQQVPTILRPIFTNIVHSFVKKDYFLSVNVKDVEPISKDTGEQIKEYIEDYGEKLIDIPNETWDSSIIMWMGTHWDVMIDLWTEGEGLSDLVLNAKVIETSDGYSVAIDMVYVP